MRPANCNITHKLSDILLLTICAVISGAEGWEDIQDFGETHIDFLKEYGDFENGIPVHDIIAIDGKTLRHSYGRSRRRGAIHVISVFSTMNSLVLGQINADEKSNEISAIPELLKSWISKKVDHN